MKKLIILVFLAAVAATAYGRYHRATPARVDPEMVQHLVFVKFKETASAESITEFSFRFATLQEEISQVQKFEYGLNKSNEPNTRDFTHLYKFTFGTASDRDAYLEHKAHKAFGEYASKLGIIEDVLVFDY